jgi:uncharacterized phage protein gp47/JayE
MPWNTPDLRTVRELVRNDVTAALYGSILIGNSVLRVMSDTMAGLCHLVLRYIDWLALQLLPDTAETVWLDRHGNIWLVNADGTTGRKAATYASGTITATGQQGFVIPDSTQLSALGVNYETQAEALMGVTSIVIPVKALTSGIIGNMNPGDTMSFMAPIAGIDSDATVIEVGGGTDPETDDELRARVLLRIRQPPMGGDQNDYVIWAEGFPGVTRAWCAPQEMGIGTVTIRFLMDDLYPENDGWPTTQDVDNVQAYMDTKRPVTVEDCFVEAPIKQAVDVTIANLVPNTSQVQAQIETSLLNMFMTMAAPGQTIYSAWISYAIMNAPGVVSFDLVSNTDSVMTAPGYMGVLGTIFYPTGTP